MNRLLPLLMLGLLFAITACEQKEERNIPRVESADQADAALQSRLEREAFISQAQNEIDTLDVRVAEIRKKAMEATGAARAKLTQHISELEQKHKNVEEKLAGLRMEIDEKWKVMKVEVTAAIEQFRKAVNKEY